MDWIQDINVAIGVFVFVTIVIVVAGTRLTKLADRIADRSGLGEALTGVLLLGACTSLPGLVASLTAAIDGKPSMAVSNAVGGIAVQTLFIVIADVCHRRANLEHAAASLGNLFQGMLLMGLLSLVLAAGLHPFASDWPVHPVSAILVIIFLAGQRIVSDMRSIPMWKPVNTAETRQDEPDMAAEDRPLPNLLVRFFLLSIATGTAGWLLARSGIVMIDEAGLDEGVVGALFTAVASSLPELVTSIVAVRMGAYTLAVSGIIGGNAFDTLFLAAADVGYLQGSIYHAAGTRDMFMVTLALAMTAVLSAGLIARQKSGPGNIGWEGISLILLYLLLIGSRLV